MGTQRSLEEQNRVNDEFAARLMAELREQDAVKAASEMTREPNAPEQMQYQ